MDIKEIVSKAFASELGQQLDGIYSTSDNRVFIRKQEAIAHTEGRLDEHCVALKDNTVLLWFEEGGDNVSIKVWPEKIDPDDNHHLDKSNDRNIFRCMEGGTDGG